MNVLNVNLDSNHKFPYKWHLKDGYPSKNIESHNLKVFGSFLCGGGSTMGYKLAGYNHLGGIEIDKNLAKVYKENHNPKYYYNEDIRIFNLRDNIPDELFNLDIFDGSPPCSTFSTAGSREKTWGKEKIFREGQSKQILDDLFFHWIKTVSILKPKIAIAENVSGLIKGNAKGYVIEINKELNKIGYNVQLFLLNAASMGVPQKRERVFFICSKKELNYPKLRLDFNEDGIVFSDIDEGLKVKRKDIRNGIKDYSIICPMGKSVSYVHPKGYYFGTYKQHPDLVSATIIADNGGGIHLHSSGKGYLTDNEYIQIGTFPLDYNFLEVEPKYLIGMSVPPVMTAQIAHQIYLQWLSK
jgi:DNA (cytosine-5)-methyltransferase 1